MDGVKCIKKIENAKYLSGEESDARKRLTGPSGCRELTDLPVMQVCVMHNYTGKFGVNGKMFLHRDDI
jgi:hypothetical protein